MNITGSFYARVVDGNNDTTGAFSSSSTNLSRARFTSGSETGDYYYSFNASRNRTGSTSSNGNHSHTVNSAGGHTHTITSTTSTTIANNSTVNSIYGKSDTVQTPSVFVKVKTRAK